MTQLTRLAALAATAAFLAPLPALAQSQLERMEVLSERASGLVNEALVAEIPALEGNLPSPEWDDELRLAFSCVLDGYRSQSSDAAVDDMLDDMEVALDGATASDVMSGEMGQSLSLPEGMTEQDSQALMGECGVMTIMMTRMAESGAMEIMMQGQ